MGDTWAPREGAYGRTRDGQKVGPLTRSGIGSWPWAVIGLNYPGEHVARWREEGSFDPFSSNPHPGDLVAEWTDTATPAGPVQMRPVIVPGVYGRVRIWPDSPSGHVRLGFGEHSGVGCYDMSASDCDALGDILTQLAGALRDPAR